MFTPTLPTRSVSPERAGRLAQIIASLTAANRPLALTMADETFRAMITQMATRQFLQEELGSDEAGRPEGDCESGSVYDVRPSGRL